MDTPYTDNSVNHPSHYNWHPTGIECKTIAEHFNFNLGMAIKYIWRSGHKNNNAVQDLRKAIACLEYEIERIEKFG